MGKAILATWPDSEVHTLWRESDVKPWTAHTIVSEEAFFHELERVRRLGYALDDEENELATKEGTSTFLNFFAGRLDQLKSCLKPICLRSCLL